MRIGTRVATSFVSYFVYVIFRGDTSEGYVLKFKQVCQNAIVYRICFMQDCFMVEEKVLFILSFLLFKSPILSSCRPACLSTKRL